MCDVGVSETTRGWEVECCLRSDGAWGLAVIWRAFCIKILKFCQLFRTIYKNENKSSSAGKTKPSIHTQANMSVQYGSDTNTNAVRVNGALKRQKVNIGILT